MANVKKAVNCPSCQKKTSGKLYQVASVRLCETCVAKAGVKDFADLHASGITRVR